MNATDTASGAARTLLSAALELTPPGRLINRVAERIKGTADSLLVVAGAKKKVVSAAMAARAYQRLMDYTAEVLEVPPDKTLIFAPPGSYLGSKTDMSSLCGIKTDELPSAVDDPRFYEFPEWLPEHVGYDVYQTHFLAPDALASPQAWVQIPGLRLADAAAAAGQLIVEHLSAKHAAKIQRAALRERMEDARQEIARRAERRKSADDERDRFEKEARDRRRLKEKADAEMMEVFARKAHRIDDADPPKEPLWAVTHQGLTNLRKDVVDPRPDLRTKAGEDGPVTVPPDEGFPGLQRGTFVKPGQSVAQTPPKKKARPKKQAAAPKKAAARKKPSKAKAKKK